MHFIQKWQFIGMVCLMSCAQSFAQTTTTDYNYELRSTLSFPNQTLANVCGWTAPNGSEYALIGASQGMVIVDVTNPAAPVQIVQIPGPDDLWKEIKTYSHYAYVTTEGGGGLQIVDLSGLPSANLTYHSYKGDGAIAGQLNKIHALHIDITKGFAYLHGSNLFQGGSVIVDLNADPYNPTYAGKYDQSGYVHDGYVDNDTLYACHINTGRMTLVDMSNKSTPQLFGSVQTPGKFTHNSWLLDDRKHILTTDEEFPSFVTSYDISDPSNIIELDRYSTNDGNGSIGHNTHVVKNSFAVTSWYTDGLTTVDISRPSNLVEVGRYDTWDAGGKFDGCWGAYPYFPSGTIIASNIDPGQLFILSPTYTHACYVEGTVLDGCNQQPLVGAKIEIIDGATQATDYSGFGGIIKTGQTTPGTFMLRLSKAGYISQVFEATLVTGGVFNFTKTLDPVSAFSLTGTVTDAAGNLLSNAQVVLTNSIQTYTLQTNANGIFNQNCMLSGQYSVVAGQWGYFQPNQVNLNFTSNTDFPIVLQPGYYDNFNIDNGWVASGTASTGAWERDEPQGTTLGGQQSNPNFDLTTDLGDQCYVTGNGGGMAASDDVDNGSVILTSPKMNLLGFEDAKLSFSYWFFNGGGQGSPPNDHFEVRITDGVNTEVVFTANTSLSEWQSSGDIFLGQYMALNDDIRIQFVTGDDAPGHIVEAAVDVFSVTPTLVGTTQPEALTKMQIQPNPSRTDFVLQYDWAGADQQPVLEIRNLIGQSVTSQVMTGKSGSAHFGADLLPGIYFVTLRSGEQQSIPVKVVKQ